MRGTDDRRERWLEDLAATLELAAQLADRGKQVYQDDVAIRLAFEAVSNRVGDLCKRLMAASPSQFTDPIWSTAARHRDFIVHHYDRIDYESLWATVTEDFPRLADAVSRLKRPSAGKQGRF